MPERELIKILHHTRPEAVDNQVEHDMARSQMACCISTTTIISAFLSPCGKGESRGFVEVE